MSWMSFQMQQQLNSQKLASQAKQTNVDVHKGSTNTRPAIATFGNDKRADSGTYESKETQTSSAAAGGSWGNQQSDAGEYSNNPSSYQQEDQNADYGADNYDNDQYQDGSYDQGSYDDGY
eukprot:TRINITY_DN6703_c0_g1_i1.p1 TRINITY_DN6703_c0_g1~~TRINITY_DN6703_c0_g1_i1.p1  ORF type:complete len:120 (+),score=24.00 TRINITY_DN6703_c0_g1_i1:442-801(+)